MGVVVMVMFVCGLGCNNYVRLFVRVFVYVM